MSNYGRETVVIVEIDQPLCTREYGDAFQSPTGGCTAVLGTDGTRKCFNTRVTCQDPANYSPGTLTLKFARPQSDLAQYGYVIPCVRSVSTKPGAINLGGMDQKMSGLGEREVVTIECEDFRHSDLLVDKYRLERSAGTAEVSALGSPQDAVSYDPYTRGTFWGKWLARNPYHENYALRVREGYLGDAFDSLRVRHYFIDRVEQVGEGSVRITAKDVFSRIDRQKAIAPTASRSQLSADIAASGVTSFSVTPTTYVDEDYPASAALSGGQMYICIGDEILRCTRSSGTFTVVARGELGTTASAHQSEDSVQWVLAYVSKSCHEIAYDLIVNYTALGSSGSPSSDYIVFSDWVTAAAELSALYTGYVAIPTAVQDLLGELAIEAGFTLYANPETNQIQFKTLSAANSSATINDDAWIVDGSLSLRRHPEKRASQVWVYYAQLDPTQDLQKRENFRSRYISADLASEGPDEYGAPSVIEVFSRWIPQFGRSLAADCGDRLVNMFRDIPVEATFSLHVDRENDVVVAHYVTLNTSMLQDDSGAALSQQHAVLSIERGENDLTLNTQSLVFDAAGLGSDVNTRTIHIENNDYNLNLRTIHDLIYAAPDGGSPTLTVNFVIDSGVVIGSTSTGSAALRTGSWPLGVTVNVTNAGYIKGAGGSGGDGGGASANASSGIATAVAGSNGGSGGTAFLVEYAITLDNENGHIWGGGGGGAGGGGAAIVSTNGVTTRAADAGGAGGGGGAGTNPGGGSSGGSSSRGHPGSGGSAGSTTGGGGAGANGADSTWVNAAIGGTGGAGGGYGSAGGSGGTGSADPGAGFTTVSSSTPTGGSGGAAGKYIDGIANVTFASPGTGDLLGGVA